MQIVILSIVYITSTRRCSLNLFTQLDDWMFDAGFQRFAHWFQRLTGKNNFFLARYVPCMIIGMLAIVGLWHPAVFIVSIMSLVNLPVTFRVVAQIERQFAKDSTSRTMNPLRAHPLGIKLRLLVTFVLGIPFWQWLFMFTSMHEVTYGCAMVTMHASLISVIYFISCTPLPPGESKFKKWLTSLKESFSEFQPQVSPT